MAIIMPDLMLKSVTQITPELLKKLNVKGIILDVDSTLAEHNGKKPYDGVVEWINSMRSANIKLNILSNNRAHRVSSFAKKLDLPFTANGAKPLPRGVLRAARQMQLDVEDTLVVGDQIYTDVMAGNLAKAKTVLLPIPSTKENLFFRFKRVLERPIRKSYLAKHGGVI